MKRPTLVALDFDGVLVDSRREVLQTAISSWRELFPQSPISQSFMDDPNCLRAFENLMPLGNRAEDFGVSLAAIEQGKIPETQEEYNDFRQELGEDFLESFHVTFYKTRSRSQRENLHAWIALHQAYREMPAILSRRGRDCTLVLATSKDEASARHLLQSWNLGWLFPKGHIYDKEMGVRKSAHLEVILRDFRLGPSEIRFIDDKVNHLLTAEEMGVRGVLAGWGHNTPREHSLAREHGIPVADFETVEKLLFG